MGHPTSTTRPPRHKAALVALTAALAAFLTVAIGGCSDHESEARGASPQQAEAVPVRVGRAIRADVPLTIEAIATAKAFSVVTIKPRVSGVAISKHFTPGQLVAAGDLLYKLDPRPYALALAKAEAGLSKSRALAKRARTIAHRKSELAAQNAASHWERDEAEAEAMALEAQAEADQAAADEARLDLEHCTITSPIDGFVGPTLTDAGSAVNANETELVVVRQVQPIYVELAVPQRRLDEIRAAMSRGDVPVSVTIPGNGEEAAGEPERGSLLFVNNTVTEETGTITLRGLFKNENARLWPGRYVNGSISLGVERDAVLVPAAAVQTGQEGAYVYLLTADQTVELRPVRIGPERDGQVVIVDGLSPDAMVVTDGHLRLKPGAPVKVLDGITDQKAAEPKRAGGVS